jgi:glycerol-3-phosphate acyltransferase PlsY
MTKMQVLAALVLLVVSYLMGSVPFGLILVRLLTGQDIRKVESGRTGGTNVMRATSFLPGLATALLDVFKSAATVWLARYLISAGIVPNTPWLEVLSPVMAVLGHNHSIFLAERDENGKIQLRGGAGGASAAGGALGLWAPSFFILLPGAMILLFVVGYASLATLSVGVFCVVIFAIRAWLGLSPWQYIFYGVFVEFLLIWALRPNIKRLIKGQERVVGLRARSAGPTPDSSKDQ